MSILLFYLQGQYEDCIEFETNVSLTVLQSCNYIIMIITKMLKNTKRSTSGT